MRRYGAISGLLLLLAAVATAAVSASEVVHIGVLAYRGEAEARARWQPTADYLGRRLEGYRFEVVPLDLLQMGQAIAAGRLHFTLTNPGNYVQLESHHGASRIATLRSRGEAGARVRYGAVIITRADRTDIAALADLAGMRFMAVSDQAFGGFQMAWRELRDAGIDPFEDLGQLVFSGFPQDRIVLAVRDGLVDAATVRAETLVHMIEGGLVSEADFRILNPHPVEGSPIPVSTRLYPEWPFATLRTTDEALAVAVARALLAMPEDHPAARVARTAGWTVPLDYSPVHELMRNLQIGPYEVLRQTEPLAVLRRYAPWVTAGALLLLGLLALNGYVSRTNHLLRDKERKLREEIRVRERTQAALARHQDSLESEIAARTRDLRRTNTALERSRHALRELVRITGAPNLSHEGRLARLLDVGCDYFDLPTGRFSPVPGAPVEPVGQSVEGASAGQPGGALRPDLVERIVGEPDSPLDIPAVMDGPEGAQASYLGIAVLAQGEVVGVLEFSGPEPRSGPFSAWDHDLLRLMAQWTGDEIERQLAHEAERRHDAEMARVARMSSVGEMAASLAHELNQPLTGALNYGNGCLRLIREGRAEPAFLQQGLERAVEGIALAGDIIRHMRDFLRRGEPERRTFPLNDAIRNALRLSGPELRRQGVELGVALDADEPMVHGDLIQLEQVILNFIRNAIDAMEAIEPEQRKLHIVSEVLGGMAWVRVADAGPGLSTEDESRMFDAFYSTRADGMGIGLSISRSIVESHAGHIQASNRPEGGAELALSLPLHGDKAVQA